jgi:hypothetical protein
MSFRAIPFDTATDGLEFGSVFLDAKEKRIWSDEHVGFLIYTIVRDDANRFGPSWVAGVTTLGEEPEHRKIRLKANPRRDTLMERLRERLDDAGMAIGPVALQLTEIDGGNTVWAIVPWTGAADSAA